MTLYCDARPRFQRRPLIIMTLGLLVLLYGALSSGAQAQTQVISCNGLVSTSSCTGRQCGCNKWVIHFSDYSTRRTVTGRTQEEARKKYEDFVAFEERWAKFIERPVRTRVYNVQGPYCDVCQEDEPNYRQVRRNAEMVVDEWGGKLAAVRDKLLRQEISEKVLGISYRGGGGGSVLKDYVRALTDAQGKLLQLRFTLDNARTGSVNAVYGLGILEREVIEDVRRVETSFNRLPAEIKDILSGIEREGEGMGERPGLGLTSYVQDKYGNEISMYHPPEDHRQEIVSPNAVSRTGDRAAPAREATASRPGGRAGSANNASSLPRPASPSRSSNAAVSNVLEQSVQLNEQKRFAEAKTLLKNAIQSHPDNALLYGVLGATLIDEIEAINYSPLLLKFKLAEAQKLVEKAVSIDAAYSVGYVLLGRIYNYQGKVTQAEVEHRRAIRLAPTNAFYWQELGQFLLGHQRWAEAEGALRQAVHLDPSDQVAVSQLRAVLRAQGKR